MDTHHIPVSAIGMAARTAEMADAPDSSAGDRLPVIEVLAEIASSMSSDANTEQMLMRFLEIMVRISSAKAGAVRVLTVPFTGDGGPALLLYQTAEADWDQATVDDFLASFR